MNTTIVPNPLSNVVSINPYKETYYNKIDNFVSELNTQNFNKKHYILSYINTRDFINSTISINRNIDDEDIKDAITSKIYDDLALDQSIEYKIEFFEMFDTTSEERTFQVFLIDPELIKNRFENIKARVNYIDCIIPAPLLIKSLYTKEIIQESGVHCFIYFQENDAFVTLYNNQEFIYTKSIPYSLIEIHEKLCELYGEKIDYNDFVHLISTENLKETTSEYKEFILKIFAEIFTKINEILTYSKRAFDLEKVEHIYIGSQTYTVSKIYEIAEYELGIKSSDFNFDYGFENTAQHIDQLHAMMQIYLDTPEDERYETNFTIFHRPPPFLRRESGKLFITILLSLIVSFAYPITYWVLTYAQSLEYALLQEKYSKLHAQRVTRESNVKLKEAEKAKVLALLKIEQDDFNDKKNTLIKIHKVKVDYPMKAKLLALLTKDINKYKVNLKTIQYSEENNKKSFEFELVCAQDKKITNLVKYLTKAHEKEFHFSLEEIKYNEKLNLYFSSLKVTLL